jgi:hypothetical protein
MINDSEESIRAMAKVVRLIQFKKDLSFDVEPILCAMRLIKPLNLSLIYEYTRKIKGR